MHGIHRGAWKAFGAGLFLGCSLNLPLLFRGSVQTTSLMLLQFVQHGPDEFAVDHKSSFRRHTGGAGGNEETAALHGAGGEPAAEGA